MQMKVSLVGFQWRMRIAFEDMSNGEVCSLPCSYAD